MLKTAHYYAIDKMYPVRYTLNELVFLPKQLIFFQNGLFDFLEDISIILCCYSFASENMNYLFDIKFVLFFTSDIFRFGFGGWGGIFKTHFWKFLF